MPVYTAFLHVFLTGEKHCMAWTRKLVQFQQKKGWLSGKLPISLQKIHSFHVFPVCRN
jgi:hypothetical protein